MNAPPRPLPDIAEPPRAARTAMIAPLARAFADDPAMAWIMPDPAVRAARLPKLFALLVDDEFASGWALASPHSEAVTLWRSSETVHGSLWDLVRALPAFWSALGTNMPRGLAVSTAIDQHHPAGQAYDYLHFAGVDPAFQGRGWGGAAIRAGLARAAARGRPVYLETATPENVGLYMALGFAVIEEWDVPRGGPHFWSMWRDKY